MSHRGIEVAGIWVDEFQPDAALIPLMSESEQLRLGIHPTHVLRDGEIYRREPKPNEENNT